MQVFGGLVERYRDFATYARGDSPCFEAWAEGVADDPQVLGWLRDLPEIKQQPNLVFAAARWHGAPAPGPYAGLSDALLGDDGRVRRTIMERSTQTNEVGRLATLVPVLGQIPGPLALVEIGASAGLCLFPDRYDYAWPPLGGLTGSGGPVLACGVDGDAPVPARHPDVAWRGGLDLNPLDVRDDDAMAWLEMLVWPEQDERRERLRAAITIARIERPRIDTGNVLNGMSSLLQRAADHGRVVVFHSAVAAYLEGEQREAFAGMMRDLVAQGRCHWISNEAPGVVPGIEARGEALAHQFVLALDGRQVAWAHGHGRSLTWL